MNAISFNTKDQELMPKLPKYRSQILLAKLKHVDVNNDWRYTLSDMLLTILGKASDKGEWIDPKPELFNDVLTWDYIPSALLEGADDEPNEADYYTHLDNVCLIACNAVLFSTVPFNWPALHDAMDLALTRTWKFSSYAAVRHDAFADYVHLLRMINHKAAGLHYQFDWPMMPDTPRIELFANEHNGNRRFGDYKLTKPEREELMRELAANLYPN